MGRATKASEITATAKQLAATNSKLNALAAKIANPPKRLGSKTKGGKRRATRALIGKAADTFTQAEIDAFWSARVHMTPPALRTTFGNFCCLNSVDRVTIPTYSATDQYVIFSWSPSGLSYLTWSANTAAAGLLTQGFFSTLQAPGAGMGNTSSILAMRPLRMSCTVSSIGSATNTAGIMRVNSFDGPLPFGGTLNWPSTSSGTIGFTSTTALPSAMQDGLDTHEIPLMDLFDPVEFVSVPASYTAYNSYYEFVPFWNSSDSTLCLGGDIYNLFDQSTANGVTYPYSAATTAAPPSNWLAGIPPMRTLVFCVPANPNQCQLRFEFHRQDGVRFNPNTLGAAFSQTPSKMTSRGEDKMLSSMSAKSMVPSMPSLASVVSEVAHSMSSLVPRVTAQDIVPYVAPMAQLGAAIATRNMGQAGSAMALMAPSLGSAITSSVRSIGYGRRSLAITNGRRR